MEQRDNFALRQDGAEALARAEAAAAQFGLALTPAQREELAAARRRALSAAGRVEFGGGILPRLMEAFCDSPYADPAGWADLLAELQESFYYYKTEAGERLDDDELLEMMAAVFNGRAQGSADYLANTSLEELCRAARAGFDPGDADGAGDLF